MHNNHLVTVEVANTLEKVNVIYGKGVWNPPTHCSHLITFIMVKEWESITMWLHSFPTTPNFKPEYITIWQLSKVSFKCSWGLTIVGGPLISFHSRLQVNKSVFIVIYASLVGHPIFGCVPLRTTPQDSGSLTQYSDCEPQIFGWSPLE